jgi:3-oxoacyl-[acyl-carrier-protein] synthase-3
MPTAAAAVAPPLAARRAAILATGAALPEAAVTTEELVARHGHAVSAAAVRKVFGVESRRVAGPGVADSDLLAEAARRCLARAGLAPERLGKLIVTKFLGDRLLPMTASLTQRKLGTGMAFQAFDVDGGTNAFLQALEVAANAVAAGDEWVLVASGGVVNRLVTRSDPRHAFLYGDGAGAVLVGPAPEGAGAGAPAGRRGPCIEASAVFTDPRAFDFARGFEMRKLAARDLHTTREYGALFDLYRSGDWKELRPLVLEAAGRVTAEVLSRAGVGLEAVDLVLVTENHGRLRSAVLEHLGVPPERTLSLLAECGNTMSAMLPLLLDRALTTGRLRPGGRVLLVSVGEGLSCGAMVATL